MWVESKAVPRSQRETCLHFWSVYILDKPENLTFSPEEKKASRAFQPTGIVKPHKEHFNSNYLSKILKTEAGV